MFTDRMKSASSFSIPLSQFSHFLTASCHHFQFLQSQAAASSKPSSADPGGSRSIRWSAAVSVDRFISLIPALTTHLPSSAAQDPASCLSSSEFKPIRTRIIFKVSSLALGLLGPITWMNDSQISNPLCRQDTLLDTGGHQHNSRTVHPAAINSQTPEQRW